MNRHANARGLNSGAAQANCRSNEPALDTETGIDFQVPVTGNLDNNTCRVGNHVTMGRTPVLSMCRELLRQGIDPDASVEIFRAGILALKIRTLRQGAALAVAEHNGT